MRVGLELGYVTSATQPLTQRAGGDTRCTDRARPAPGIAERDARLLAWQAMADGTHEIVLTDDLVGKLTGETFDDRHIMPRPGLPRPRAPTERAPETRRRRPAHDGRPRHHRDPATASIWFSTGVIGVGPDRRHVRLPRIGLVRTHESTRKLARRIEVGTARIRSARLSWRRGRWHVALSVELPDPAPPVREGGRVVGVGLGIKSLAVLSTGEVVPNPRHLDATMSALRRAQGKLPLAGRQVPALLNLVAVWVIEPDLLAVVGGDGESEP
ncbi:MAG: hypothetical protein ACRD0H_31805 [Actinomycetes bacterium]